MPKVVRSYLFLQGVCSPFFSELAKDLLSEGHRIAKINFNAGDSAYWNGHNAYACKDAIPSLAAFYDHMYAEAEATDIVLFGDRRPVHRPAIEIAQRNGLRIHVFEEGYFRPHWVTLERSGVNAHSPLPRDPAWYRSVGASLKHKQEVSPFSSPFRTRAVHDLLYHLAGLANPLLFPRYKTHAPHVAPVMYAGYIRRFALQPFHIRQDQAAISALIEARTPYYLLPLQLNSDAQIKDHSSFSGMIEVMDYVIQSFALHAPAESRLVIKNHPLDMGLIPYAAMVRQFARTYGVEGRLLFLETGNLELLVMHARGTVTVNSTVGGVALQFNCPVITLSDPIYNLVGLTFQGRLDHFWKQAEPPDQALFDCFKAIVTRATQINGGFYCKQGIALAVKNSLQSLTAEKSPLEELL